MEIKCKLCGGRLVFKDDSFLTTCDSCGISQFLFDYLEKDSDDYDEQVEHLKAEREAFEKLYCEYEDDVVNAKSYCLTSKELLEIIDFFDKCGEYKDASYLLKLAKMNFILKISSLSDCSIALKFLDEVDVFSYEEKEMVIKRISELSTSFMISELKENGFLVVPPKEISCENILSTMRNLLNSVSKNQEHLSATEKELVSQSLSECVEYLKTNTLLAINDAQDEEVLCEIRRYVPLLKQNFLSLQGWNIEKDLNGKIEVLSERTRLAEEKLTLEIKKENNWEMIKKVFTLVVVIAIIFGVIALSLYPTREFPSKNISIKVLEKINNSYNEEDWSGYSDSGYSFSFDLEITNNGDEDVNLIYGNLEIVSKQGKVLSSASLTMKMNMKADSSIRYTVHLNIETGPCARELWETELKDLEISFKIQKITLANMQSYSYESPQKIIIHKIES